MIFISLFMIYSGFTKVIDIYQFINNLSYYKYIPESFQVVIGIGVPIIEILIGIGILNKHFRDKAVDCYLSTIIIFICVLLLHYGSYMPQGCGCFGVSKGETINYLMILRDLLFLIPCLLYKFLNNLRIRLI